MYHPRFKGNHFDIGLKFGKILRKKNIDFDKIIRLDDFQTDFGKKSQTILSNVFPEVCDEIRGMTEGLNYPYEKFASWLLCMGCCYGYIHFAGVHPDYRGIGIGVFLYDRFFGICRENDRNIIKACTSPVNKGSIEFHKKIGFNISNGDAVIDGVQVTLDYNKPDDPKVRFEIRI